MAVSAAVLEALVEKINKGEVSVNEAAASLPSSNGHGKLTCVVSRKGCVSVYGLQRMPVTLYAEQWERLLEGFGDHFVLKFIRQWEGKSFTRTDREGEYTAIIARK